ncbi:MAG: 50S ribosomal protein L35 [Gemmataceae bacterium]|nr:50S ribosomal protein L35 [Gemmataceae bacterium]MDW8241957.1 50S ribosomal protein L35 [Thermogemmata sp.]
MPSKNKTNKSVAKRFKVTANGKLKYAKSNRRHLNAHISSKRMRRLRQPGVISGRPAVLRKYKRVLGVE